MRSALLYGPQGSGKTRYAERIKNYLKLNFIADGIDLDSQDLSRSDTLFITNQNPNDFAWDGRFDNLKMIQIDNIKREMNLKR